MGLGFRVSREIRGPRGSGPGIWEENRGFCEFQALGFQGLGSRLRRHSLVTKATPFLIEAKLHNAQVQKRSQSVLNLNRIERIAEGSHLFDSSPAKHFIPKLLGAAPLCASAAVCGFYCQKRRQLKFNPIYLDLNLYSASTSQANLLRLLCLCEHGGPVGFRGEDLGFRLRIWAR